MPDEQAVLFSQFGDPSAVLEPTVVDRPTPGQGEVLVKLLMSPIHNHDLLMIRGMYGVKPPLPSVGGTEAVGMVEPLGSGVTNLNVGDRVAAGGVNGAWADHFIARAAGLVPVPTEMSDELAAQLMSMPMSALMALNSFNTNAGDWIVVNAGNGAVGKVFGEVGPRRGLRIALLVRREEARRELNDLGINDVFVTDDGWKDELKAAVGNDRVAGAINMIGGKFAGELAHFVSDNGLLLSFGSASGEALEINPADLIYKQISVRGFWAFKEFAKATPAELQAMIGELFTLSADGKLNLPVERVFPLSQAGEAAALAATSRTGKVLLEG